MKPLIYSSLIEKTVIDGSEEDILQLGKALGISNIDISAEKVLDILVNSLCSIDESGNALVESTSLTHGKTIRGIVSENGEIHIPKQVFEEEMKEGESDELGTSSQKEYNLLRDQMKADGFFTDTVPLDFSSQDAAAIKIWRNQMRGSVVAGFQLALRAGPICEEPVRGVLVVLEGLEVAIKPSSDDEFKCAKPLTGGMVVAAIRSGIRCSLL